MCVYIIYNKTCILLTSDVVIWVVPDTLHRVPNKRTASCDLTASAQKNAPWMCDIMQLHEMVMHHAYPKNRWAKKQEESWKRSHHMWACQSDCRYNWLNQFQWDHPLYLNSKRMVQALLIDHCPNSSNMKLTNNNKMQLRGCLSHGQILLATSPKGPADVIPYSPTKVIAQAP